MAVTDVTTSLNLRLAMLNLPLVGTDSNPEITALASPILARQREFARLLQGTYCPADARIQSFLDTYLADTDTAPKLPNATLVLDEPGLARSLSLPFDGDRFESDLVTSYRLANGVLHNPRNDRRTTAGVFHIAEGGLAINDDKRAVPKAVWGRLLEHAFNPPAETMVLPFGATSDDPPATFVSLLLRPVVVPKVPGYTQAKSMEIRFIAPGGLVSNLDFVEGIFGNAGDPNLPENDAALNPLVWTGHTGCVILAPHLTKLTKKDLGLPRYEDATERQRRDHMCWRDESELYNDGSAFKAVARDESGVIVTIIADNYFGYCKKEVKTQIGYSANLYGASEEEHAGGALVYPAYDEGRVFTMPSDGVHTLGNVIDADPERFVRQPEGHAIDTLHPEFVLVPAGSTFTLPAAKITWEGPDGHERSIGMRADRIYFGPDGYRVTMKPGEMDPSMWTLVGVSPDVTQVHKPSTVSGGGKSEISKSLSDAIGHGTAFVRDFDADMDAVQAIVDRDFSNRFADESRNGRDHRSILSADRSVGSVIKLMTPSPDFNDEHNAWIETVPSYLLELLVLIKSSYKPKWGPDWRSHFSVGAVNGHQSNALMLNGDPIHVHMLRVGYEPDGAWRMFSLRPDFAPAAKVQTEDDITASTVSPDRMGTRNGFSAKYVNNAERLLFQRPDDAIHPGYDTQAEADIAAGAFLSNFEPLTREDAQAMRDNAVALSKFTAPMRGLIERVADAPDDSFFVCSARPRMVNGAPSKNPRYLQVRPDLANAIPTAASDLASHLRIGRSTRRSLPLPVDIVAAGRRNNPPSDGVPALCAFNPLHYLELPELFMEFISSMTGKSPSTTGAGSEGALTKAPFNAMPTVFDLNANLLSYVLSGYDGWISSAGYVGPKMRVDHDVSLLVPEVFSRMSASERDAKTMIERGFLEKVEDIEVDGRVVQASRLGYRMTRKFATSYFARVFMHPNVVFTPEMLRPELQDFDAYVETVDTVVATHERVARSYLDDGTIDLACPPLRALLEIMANGSTASGLTLHDPEFRGMFDRDTVMASDWYQERLDARQAEAIRHARAGLASLDAFMAVPGNAAVVHDLALDERRQGMADRLALVTSDKFRNDQIGTLGRQPRMR